MSRNEWLEKYRHSFAGIGLDGAVQGRQGAELALWARQIMRKVDELLVSAWADANPSPTPPGEGKTTTAAGGKK